MLANIVLRNIARRNMLDTAKVSLQGLSTVAEEKKARKEKRAKMWDERRANKVKRKVNRKNRVRGTRKAEWESFFVPFKNEYDVLKDKVDWTIRVAAIVERLPIVTPDEPKWATDYYELRDYLDSFGTEYPEGNPFVESWHEDEGKETYDDLLKLLPEGLRPAPRETEADHSGFIHTTDRALKQRVYLTVKSSLNETDDQIFWEFPSVDLKDEESLLDAANRAISEAAGNDLVTYALGNAPIAFDYTILPTKDGESLKGVKTFYYRITRDKGDVKRQQDCAWLTRDEFVKNAVKQHGEDSHIPKLHHYHLST